MPWTGSAGQPGSTTEGIRPVRHVPARLVSVFAVGFLSAGTAGAFPLLPAAADGGWGDLEATDGTDHVAVLEDGTTVLLSTGGSRDQVVFEQRRAPDGDLGPRTVVTSFDHGAQCAVGDVDVQASTVAFGVDCVVRTGEDEPPGIAGEFIWTEATGWVRESHRKSEVSSVDVSPDGGHAVFTTYVQYAGTPHHVTTWSAADGMVDHERPQRGLWGDDFVAGVGDGGRVTVLCTAGFEDEPGYWGFGRLVLERLDPETGEWSMGRIHRYESQGIRGVDLDVAADGSVTGSFLRFRSTAGGWPDAPDTSVWMIRQQGGTPTTLVPVSEPSRDVFVAESGVTAAGVGVVAWQQGGQQRALSTRRTHWLPDAAEPAHARQLERGLHTEAVAAGFGLSLAVGGDGHTVLGWVTRDDSGTTATTWASAARAPRPDDAHSRVWQGTRNVTVRSAAGAGGESAVLLGHLRWYGVLGEEAGLTYRP